MMNKSKIDWCDFTWNPVTGCNRGCPYCYARRQAARFSGDVRLNKSSEQIVKNGNGTYILEKPFKNEKGRTLPFPVGFEPTYHEYRLLQPKEKAKEAVIFVCSMGDLFAPDIPDDWITTVIRACEIAPWHTYLFLTKYPRRYEDLQKRGHLPKRNNFWYGTSVTGNNDEFFADADYNTFISIEPIKERIYSKHDAKMKFMDWGIGRTDWAIIGAETGHDKNKVTPEREWISELVDDLHSVGKGFIENYY